MKRLIPFIFLILLLIAAVASVPFLLQPERHRAEITDKLSKLLKHPVVIGQISMVYWPPALRLEKMGVMNDMGTPILQIEGVTAPLDISSLLHLNFVPTELQCAHAVLTTTRRVDGHWDAENWFSGSTAITLPGSVPLSQISWKESEVHAVDPYAGQTQTLVVSSLDGKWNIKNGILTTTGLFSGSVSSAHLSLSAKGQFLAAPQWSADVQFTDENRTGTFHLDRQTGSLDLKGTAGAWKLADVLAFAKFYGRGAMTSGDASSLRMLENWQLHAHNEGERTTFEETATVAGGLSEFKGSIDHRILHADIALKDIPADALWEVAGEKIPLSGKVTGIASGFEVTLSSPGSRSVNGQGYVEFKEGRYLLPDVSVKKLAKAKTMGYLKKKFPDLEQNGIPVTRLSAHWQAKDGKISTSDGFLVSTDVKVGAVGSLDAVRQGIDGYLRLQLREKNPALSRLIPIKYHTQAAFGRIQGTWQEWFLRSTPTSKIPSRIQSQLSKAINQK